MDFLAGGGEMGARIRAHDWASTPLGPVDAWPQSLRTSVSICLDCSFPILVWWGADLVMLYNDEYRPILGSAKHPAALGERGAQVWPEIWDVIGPMLRRVMEHGEATRARDLLLILERNGYPEECYFSFSYSPIRDESGGVGGVFCPVIETTEKVVGERRLRTLRDLAAQSVGAESASAACHAMAAVLADNPQDIPFAAIYVIDGSRARLAATAGIGPATPASPDVIDLSDDGPGWPLASAARRAETVVVTDLAQRFRSLPCGAWPEPPHSAMILPVVLPGQAQPTAVLIAAASPRRALDDDFRSFFELVAGHVESAIADALAYEEERRRAEALAEIDRAKTLFFSNVSHEFRTPLTLMLGPLEEALSRSSLAEEVREQLAVAHRNGLRLLKLVNSLLDFSRVEAGRMQAVYDPTDLATVTADLASNFRSACERAGLRLVVDCPPLPHPVYVDRDMWEKIVLNLLSNAFKFTFEGEIAVALRAEGGYAELTVRDTGTGIEESELPRIFERFHRVADARGRTHEGTGIGLALVQQLVKFHDGTIGATSTYGRGTTFTVRMPFGTAHLPTDRVGGTRTQASTATRAEAYVEEAIRWLPDGDAATMLDGFPEPVAPAAPDLDRPRVLLADDNADMRHYMQRLLAARYDIEAVEDGQAALEAAKAWRPELVLADVMMPRLDGFGLLKALRAEPDLRDVPVVLVSARAGEEAQIEGLEAGADDYLVKPFGARELLARIRTNLDLARLRRDGAEALRESEARFRHMADHAPVMVWVTKPDGSCTFLSKSWYEFTGQSPETGLGFGWTDAVHPDDRPDAYDAFAAANARHEPFRLEYRLRRADGAYRWAIDAAAPRFGEDGEFLGYIGSVIDITERKQSEQHLQLLINELNHRVRNTLATVQSIAAQALRGAPVAKGVRESIESRLVALSRSHDLLTREGWESVRLRDVVRQAVEPFGARFTIEGDEIRLRPKSALALGMAFHELATNATKHGALSNGTGRVGITWTVEGDRLRLKWQERDGPPVSLPSRKGFGARLIERGLARELDGTVRLDYAREGVVCVIDAPAPRPG